MSFSNKNIKFKIKVSTFFIRFFVLLSGGNIAKAKNKSNDFKAKLLTKYFAKKYLPAVKIVEQKEVTTENPETIWQFWDNPKGEKTPEIIKSCLESTDKFKGNFERKILNNSTFKNFSDLPAYVLDKFKSGKIDYTHFSDLLRLNLLKNHGGIWLDATAYMTDFVPKYILDEDFFVFLIGNLTRFPYSFMQSCFIRAKKGSFLCDEWYQMCIDYWKTENKKLEYFQIHLMFKAFVDNNPTAKKLFSQMPKVSEDGIHCLIGDNLFKKFDFAAWEKIKNSFFFQKTTYKVPKGIDYSNTYYSKLCEGNI